MHLVIILLTTLNLNFPLTIDQKIWFYANLHDVNPITSKAITYAETGNIPEEKRDLIISHGNYGRYQINCSIWKKKLSLKSCKELLTPNVNIKIGNYILGRFKKRFAFRSKCKCSKNHHWTAHYNEGIIVKPIAKCIKNGICGERYARRVEYYIKKFSQ